MTEEKAKEVKKFYSDSSESIKKESLGLYYILQNYGNTSKVMRAVAQTIKIPLMIICSDTPPWTGLDSVNWKKCLEVFAGSFTNRKFILAKNCGHYVFIDNPTLVMDEIIRQYRKVATL